MSQSFTAGRHTFSATLVPDSVVERIRIERKKDMPADYVAAVRRLGFDPGPDGAVSRERAAAAVRFIREQRRLRQGAFCGDITLPEPAATNVTVASAASTPDGTAPAPAKAATGPGPTVDPPSSIGAVLLPPQEQASPVTPLQTEAARPGS
jgi:hypothetical protein